MILSFLEIFRAETNDIDSKGRSAIQVAQGLCDETMDDEERLDINSRKLAALRSWESRLSSINL